MQRFEEVACTYSALILADDDIPITAEKINTILKAANVSVESIWPNLFARALGSVNVKELITNVGSLSSAGSASAGAASAPAAAAAAPGAESKASEKKAEEKKAESDSEDDDMGFGLFD